MAKNIEPNLKKIGEYLKIDEDSFFAIPEYQRPYSWKIEQCNKLWNDIVDFSESDEKDAYFFGTIILSCIKNDTQLDIIDGQQRTTTFLLLLKALLIRVNFALNHATNDPESSELYRGLKGRRREIMSILYKVEADKIEDLPNTAKDREIYATVNFLKNHSINEEDNFKQELGRILSASDFSEAEASVIKLPRLQKDNKYTNYFRNFKFFVEQLNDKDCSDSKVNMIAKTILEKCEIIEIKSWQFKQAIAMFNSLNADGLPLYDADIISALLYASAEKNGERDAFKAQWEKLKEGVDVLSEKGISDIDSILMQQMYYERAKAGELVSFTGAINVTTPGLRKYFTEINPELLDHPIELCQKMNTLVEKWQEISDYPCVRVLLKFNENAKLFLASYLLRDEHVSEAELTPIVEAFLKLFTILELVDTGYSSKNFKMFLFGEAPKIANADFAASALVEDFQMHLQKSWQPDDIKLRISEYDGNSLVILNEYLFAKEHSMPFDLEEKYDIEHIMPASGKNIDTIRSDAGITSEEEFKTIVNRLGNKILLESKINRAIGNEWFRTKVSTSLLKRTGYIDSKYPLAISLVSNYRNAECPIWTKENIFEATERSSERITKFIFS